MNLFVTNRDPMVAAKHLDDIRLNKMIVESCQMLVMAAYKNGAPKDKLPLTKSGKPYKVKGHINHPVTVWTAWCDNNYLWHLMYLKAMLAEYYYRTGKTHAGINVSDWAQEQIPLIPRGSLTPFQNCSHYKETVAQDVPECYRQTLIDKWLSDKIKVKWTKREPPGFAPRTVKVGEVYIKFTEKEESQIEQVLLSPQSYSQP